jgi:polyhydroxyalkanoate synthase
MSSAFTWLRPDDLVFNYWVNNYLMGDKPPAFDILTWNTDGTNLPGALHGQFLEIFRDNLLTRPGALSVLGTPLRLQDITYRPSSPAPSPIT